MTTARTIRRLPRNLNALLISAVFVFLSRNLQGQELGQRLNDYLTRRSDFSGVIVVERHGRLIVDKGFGKADYELNVANDDTKIFRIGSLSKPMTAVALMAMQERGQVTIDDALCKYLPSCPAAWQTVRLRHLLSHTSGIPDYFGEVAAAPLSGMRSVIDRTVAAHAQSPLAALPGSVYKYSNFGYLLLGYVIEVASHGTWERVLDALVWKPSGMTRTAYDDVWRVTPGRVRGYDRKDGLLRNIAYKDHGAFAAGGLESSAQDLLAFEHSLTRGKLLSSASLHQLFTPILGNYALGWQVMEILQRKIVNHTGEIDGFTSHLAFYPDEELVIIVLSNVGDEPAKTTACDLARLVFDAGPTVLDDTTSNRPTEEQLERIPGTYRSHDATRVIRRDGEKLFYVRSAEERHELVRISGSKFRAIDLGGVRCLFEGNALTVVDGCDSPVGRYDRE